MLDGLFLRITCSFLAIFVLFSEVEGYFVEKGSEELQDDPFYIRTSSIKKNLAYLARIVCSGIYPVLLEGETSAGKTTMVGSF